jgi:hypothetical protein
MSRREVLLSVEIPDIDIQEFAAWEDFKGAFARDEYIFLNKEEEKKEKLAI